MPAKKPKVSVIILNYNGRELISRCLDSIKAKTKCLNYEILVIDNGSVDGSIDLLKRKYTWVKLIPLEKNLGFAKANNIGMEKSNGQYIFLLNNDTEIITENWLHCLLEIAESDSRIGIVGCKLIYPDGRLQCLGGGRFSWKGWSIAHYVTHENEEAQYITGAALLIKRSVIRTIGCLDEDFSPLTFEDADWCMRAKKAGFKIVYDHRVVVIHSHGATIRRRRDTSWENFIYYNWQKNKIRFILQYFSLNWIIRRIPYELGIAIGYAFLGRVPPLLKAYYVNLVELKHTLQKRHLCNKIG